MLSEGNGNHDEIEQRREVKLGRRRKEMALTDQFPICHKWFRQFWCDIQQFSEEPTNNNVAHCQKPLTQQQVKHIKTDTK